VGKRASSDERENERKRERRAANQKAGDHGEQAENTKARQERRAASKKAGDNRENERQRERRAEHQKQWKDHPTGADLTKQFAHTTGARYACRHANPGETRQRDDARDFHRGALTGLMDE